MIKIKKIRSLKIIVSLHYYLRLRFVEIFGYQGRLHAKLFCATSDSDALFTYVQPSTFSRIDFSNTARQSLFRKIAAKQKYSIRIQDRTTVLTEFNNGQEPQLSQSEHFRNIFGLVHEEKIIKGETKSMYYKLNLTNRVQYSNYSTYTIDNFNLLFSWIN